MANKTSQVRPEIVGQVETEHGYSLVAMASHRGRRRRYWWHCGGCWEACEPSRFVEDVSAEAYEHLLLCPGQLGSATVSVLPAVAEDDERLRVAA